MKPEKKLFFQPFIRAICKPLGIGGVVLVCLLQAVHGRAAVSQNPARDVDPIELYFSDEQMVEAPSRYPKPLTQVAENVTVIEAEEIAASNARSVAELLDRVPGVFVSFNGQDFGSTSSLYIHGSTGLHSHHTLVLLDGVRYNYTSSGNAETNDIPLAIIQRIEIIKGPASSAWGSALGGVINIMTKTAGKTVQPSGTLAGTWGEGRSRTLHSETAGLMGSAGYYFYAGRQDSDGLYANRFFRNNSVYAKVELPFAANQELILTGNQSTPEQKYFDYALIDSSVSVENRNQYMSTTWNGSFAGSWTFSLSGYAAGKKFLQKNDVLGAGLYGPAGDSFRNFLWKEQSLASHGRLVWQQSRHTASIGFEYMRSELSQVIDNGPFLQGFGFPAQAVAAPGKEEKWGLYVNDTLIFGKLTLVPGLRYDAHSITESFVSPSLGAIFQWRQHTLVRATMGRGFSAPFLAQIAGGGSAFGTINPDLKPETVSSCQLGLESVALSSLRLKASGFVHELENRWSRDMSGKPVNAGRDRRIGFEIEMNTDFTNGLSLEANYSSVFEKVYDTGESDNLQAANLRFIFQQPEDFKVELSSHYAWWQARETTRGHYSSPTWDLQLRKIFFIRDYKSLEAFISVRNLFDGSQYWAEFIMNPGRSVDGGLRFSF